MKVRQSLLNGPMPEPGSELASELASNIRTIDRSDAPGLHSVQGIRAVMRDRLTVLGWSDRVRIKSSCGITISAMNRGIGLCVQTGNMARFYADLMKLQLVFADGLANGALYVIPTKRAAQELGSNVVNYERVVAEARLFAKIITVPLVVLGFEDEEGA